MFAKTQRYLLMVGGMKSPLFHGFYDKMCTIITLPMFCYARNMTQIKFMGHNGVT